MRYLGEARAQRKKALKAWCAFYQERNSQFPKRTQWGRSSRYIRPHRIPRTTPIISANQSFISALRLKFGWMSSMRPPNVLAPTKTGINPKRPVLASGKESAAKAMRCTTLSLPSGTGGGASKGHSNATVKMRVTLTVIGISWFLRIDQSYYSQRLNATIGLLKVEIIGKLKVLVY